MKTALFIGYYPQMTSGPITKYQQMKEQLYAPHRFAYDKITLGMQRILWGLFKKLVISTRVANIVNGIYGDMQTYDGLYIWTASFLFMLQLYTDFSGCMDIIMGVSECYGIDLPENFKTPFFARSVQEYWQRWHITLGAWFRDYVYIPMGGNRVCMPRWILNILVVWLFTGLWHGAGWNFITWGLLFAALLVVEKGAGRVFAGRKSTAGSIDGKRFSKKNLTGAAAGILKHGYVVFVILVSFLIFHNDSLADAFSDIQSLFAQGSRIAQDAGSVERAVFAYVLRNRIVILCIGLIGSTPLPFWLWTKLRERLLTCRIGDRAVHVLMGLMVLGLMVLCTAYLIDGSFNPFLYFRF